LNLIVEPENSGLIPVGNRQAVGALSYPRERIPKQPVLSVATFTQYAASSIPSVLEAGAVRYVSRGCMAIGLALEHAQVGGGDEVLLPAYHCISMIEPVIWRRSRPVFYRINADTSINLDDIEARITKRTRALYVTHYFGFPQDMVRIRAFCDAHRLLLIEDCAHAFFGSIGDAPIGSFGDYAIASTWKFFPVYDGGLIVSARKDLTSLKLETPIAWVQAKALVNTLEQAFEYRRLSIARLMLKAPLLLKDVALRRLKRTAQITPFPASEPTIGLGGWGFDASLINRKTSISSRLITAMASKHRITERRRYNYLKLLGELRNLPGCRPLFPSLPNGVVPQVFPLVFAAPERAFQYLKQAGVPIIRFGEYLWEGLDLSTCPVSTELSRCVFQLPCHQELSAHEMEWMIGCIRTLLARCHNSVFSCEREGNA
jgi:dTDP-4-amino-4,6-dideoxygalactose transaminase